MHDPDRWYSVTCEPFSAPFTEHSKQNMPTAKCTIIFFISSCTLAKMISYQCKGVYIDIASYWVTTNHTVAIIKYYIQTQYCVYTYHAYSINTQASFMAMSD